MKKKQCPKCKQTLDCSEFYKNKNSKDGLGYQCKECERKYKEEKWASLKLEAINTFGGQCAHIDENGIRCLKNSIDDLDELELSHPNGDGNEHRNLISDGRKGYRFYRALKRRNWNTDGYVIKVMCKSHHSSFDKSGKKHPNYKDGKFNDPIWLRKRYVDDLMTQRKIGDLCGVSHQTIGRRINKFNIQR